MNLHGSGLLGDPIWGLLHCLSGWRWGSIIAGVALISVLGQS